MAMRLEHLRYFVEVAKSGSFSYAAKKLYVTQPNISQAIFRLEEELGVKLFERSHQGVKLTEIGLLIFQRAEDVISKIEEIKAIANEAMAATPEKIVISASKSICTTFLPKTVIQFSALYPDIQLEIVEGGAEQIVTNVLHHKADIRILFCRPWELNPSLYYEKLFRGKLLLYVGKKSTLPLKSPMPLNQIAHLPMVVSGKSYRTIDRVNEVFKKPNFLYKTRDDNIAKKIISEGRAVGFFPDFTTYEDKFVQSGEILPLEIEHNPFIFWVAWIRHKEKQLSKRQQQFVSMLKRVIKEYGYFQEHRDKIVYS